MILLGKCFDRLEAALQSLPKKRVARPVLGGQERMCMLKAVDP